MLPYYKIGLYADLLVSLQCILNVDAARKRESRLIENRTIAQTPDIYMQTNWLAVDVV